MDMRAQSPIHGGNLEYAQTHWPKAPLPWLDLSAALNPQPWPVPEIPTECFQRLPDPEYRHLCQIAAQYYQQDSLWPVSGSQQIIELLPKLRASSVVAVPEIGYAEHEWCWRKAGHQVLRYQGTQVDHVLESCDVLVVINPNNPSAAVVSQQQLIRWHQRLQAKGGWLIVDEAFIEAYPITQAQQCSMADMANQPGLIVLRSIGKFFGLAGIRSGFVLTEAPLLMQIKQHLGPWHLNGVAAYLTASLLQDAVWQQQSRLWLAQQSASLVAQLEQASLPLLSVVGATPLFITLSHPNAEALQSCLAAQGIWVRLFQTLNWLRIGIPASLEQHQRLLNALRSACAQLMTD